MAYTFRSVGGILRAKENLIPFIAERAFLMTMFQFVMSGRVEQRGDMQGWNLRKVSEYNPGGRASQLSEATDIPTKNLDRKFLAQIEPEEWGDRYPISDRRVSTDGENIIADCIRYLGYSLGYEREQKLMSAVRTSAGSNTLGNTSNAFSLDYLFQSQALFMKEGVTVPSFAAIHPYQLLDVQLEFNNLSLPAVTRFRDQAQMGFINNRTFTSYGNTNVAVAPLLPRTVTYKLDFSTADGGTFRLRVGGQTTGEIAYNANVATLSTNIETALNALDGESGWNVTGSDQTDLTIVAPRPLSGPDELMVAYRPEDDSGERYYNDLTDGGVAGDWLIISERSATADALFWAQDAVIYDRRSPLNTFMEEVNQGRTVEVSQYEVYGVGPWRGDRAILIQTDASAPNAVGS
jgi:hypothetical protein